MEHMCNTEFCPIPFYPTPTFFGTLLFDERAFVDRVTFHSRRPAWKKRVCRSFGQIGGNYCATTLHKSKSKNTSIFKKNYMFMAQRF